MIKTVNMKTVCPDGIVRPIAGRQSNTIRKLSHKYANVEAGTPVAMEYIDGEGETLGSESLIVSSAFAGCFNTVVANHGMQNHYVIDRILRNTREASQAHDEDYRIPDFVQPKVLLNELKQILFDAYGYPDIGEDGKLDVFVAYYFR